MSHINEATDMAAEARELLASTFTGQRLEWHLDAAFAPGVSADEAVNAIAIALSQRDAALTASQEQQQTIQRLTSALNVAKAAILKAAEDTLWCDDSPAETVIDRINAALYPDETADLFSSEPTEVETLRLALTMANGILTEFEEFHDDHKNKPCGDCDAECSIAMGEFLTSGDRAKLAYIRQALTPDKGGA